jgi:molybdenum cofactor cytidylyltransferase
MGRPKLSLPLGGKAVLTRVIESLRQAGLEKILAVIGPNVPELVPLARDAGADVLLLDEPTPDLRASVERGLDWIERAWRPSVDDAWLLVPGDCPAPNAEVARRLIRAREEQPSAILIPTYQGRRGHPTLVAWAQVPSIRAQEPGLRLNAYFRGQAAETREIPLEFPEILEDLDTPADYERWRKKWEAGGPGA